MRLAFYFVPTSDSVLTNNYDFILMKVIRFENEWETNIDPKKIPGFDLINGELLKQLLIKSHKEMYTSY